MGRTGNDRDREAAAAAAAGDDGDSGCAALQGSLMAGDTMAADCVSGAGGRCGMDMVDDSIGVVEHGVPRVHCGGVASEMGAVDGAGVEAGVVGVIGDIGDAGDAGGSDASGGGGGAIGGGSGGGRDGNSAAGAGAGAGAGAAEAGSGGGTGGIGEME